MLKKFVSIIISTLLMLSLLTVSISAASIFSDVTNTKYPWAIEQIEEMADLGIIKGYNAKIFAPEDSVTKMQALLLCARILGSIDEQSEEFINLSKKLYGDIVKQYNEQYVDEVSYLIFKGVISINELSIYISEDNASVALKRYEAATLLTKAMNAVSKAEKLTSPTVFKDSSDIPAVAKPYVNFVYSNGLMQGMTATEFVPLYDVTRAQMAVLLYRMRESLEENRIYGIVNSVNAGTVMYTDSDGESSGVSILSKADTQVYVDGYASLVNSIPLKSIICITKRGVNIYRIDAITVMGDETFKGAVTSITTTSSVSKIKVHEIDSSEVIEFRVSPNVSVSFNGAASSLSNVKTGNYVEMQITNGEVIVIKATPKQSTVVGTVSEIVFTPQIRMIIDLNTGDTADFEFAEQVTVERNNKTVSTSEVLVGDKVTLSLMYNKINSIKASSSSFVDTGTIEEIVIAIQPSITISSKGQSTKYSLSRDASYVIDGIDPTIYDLRLNGSVSVTIEGSTVTKISSYSPTVASALTGKISLLNSAYGFFILEATDYSGKIVTTQIFFKSTTIKIYDSVGRKEVSYTALKQDMNVTVTGYMETGAFVASAIVVLP